jgi:O-antigen/teichoic acid export membrane protein
MSSIKPEKSIQVKTIKGSIHYTIAGLLSKIVKVTASIFLARVLSPDDYGLVAIALVFISGMRRFNQFGLNAVLIRRKTLSRRLKGNGNSLKFILSLISFSVIFLASAYWAKYFNNGAIEDILKVMSFLFLIDAFVYIDKVVLIRDLRFKALGVAEIVAILVGSTSSLILAYNGYNYWSLVYGTLLASISKSLVIKISAKEDLEFRLNIRIIQHVLSFGGWVLLGSVLFWGYTTIDNIVIGKLLGTATLGYYVVAYGWGTFASENIQNVLTTTLLPAYSLMKGSPKRIKKAFLKVARVNSLILMPVTFGLMSVADYFIMFILGEKWWPSYEILLILSIFGFIRGLESGSVSVFYAMNKPKYYVLLSAITFVLMLLTLYPAINSFGLIGAGISVTFSIFISFIVQLVLLSRLLKLSINDFLSIWRLPFASSMLMVLAISLMKSLLLPGLASLAYLIVIGIIVYLTALIVFTKGDIFNLYLELKKG